MTDAAAPGLVEPVRTASRRRPPAKPTLPLRRNAGGVHDSLGAQGICGEDRSPHARQGPQPLRVAYGVAVAVVVEVHEHVVTGTVPFLHAISPPAQVLVTVRAGVQVVRVGAV